MLYIVYVLGRAGSGKSTVALKIKQLAHNWGLNVEHLFDYSFLDKRFRQEIANEVPTEQRAFKQLDAYNPDKGFDVVEFNVLDDVLRDIADEILEKEKRNQQSRQLYIVEFARQKNGEALEVFNKKGLVRGSLIIYVNLDVEDCIARIRHRATENPSPSKYDHPVSDFIMRSYYSQDDWGSVEMNQYLDSLRRDGLTIKTEQIANDGSISTLDGEIEEVLQDFVFQPV